MAERSWRSVPDAVKRLIDRFLDIMDHNTEDAGGKLATEIFTPDGVPALLDFFLHPDLAFHFSASASFAGEAREEDHDSMKRTNFET